MTHISQATVERDKGENIKGMTINVDKCREKLESEKGTGNTGRAAHREGAEGPDRRPVQRWV